MKYCEICSKDVRISKHDGICPICGNIIVKKDTVKANEESILSSEEIELDTFTEVEVDDEYS